MYQNRIPPQHRRKPKQCRVRDCKQPAESGGLCLEHSRVAGDYKSKGRSKPFDLSGRRLGDLRKLEPQTCPVN